MHLICPGSLGLMGLITCVILEKMVFFVFSKCWQCYCIHKERFKSLEIIAQFLKIPEIEPEFLPYLREKIELFPKHTNALCVKSVNLLYSLVSANYITAVCISQLMVFIFFSPNQFVSTCL